MHHIPRIVCIPLWLFFLGDCFAAEPDWKGHSVVEFLDSLNDAGYRIIFSSDVVTDDLIVIVEPDLTAPIAGLRATLAAVGLTLESGPANTWLVRKRVSLVRGGAVHKQVKQLSLPEIVVTSSLHSLEYTQSGTHTYLDRELATRIPAAAEEVVRITNRLPGTANGGISTRGHVRGGEANEVLFLVDGHRLYEPYHLKDFQAVATIVNSSAVDGVDFYTGAYPARFGDRMSGVINVSLREPRKSMETEVSLSFFNTSAVSLGTFGDDQQGDWLLAARRGNLDLIADVINPELGSPDYSDYLLHGGWTFGPRLQFSANFLASNDKLVLADVDRGEMASANYENRVLWLNWRAQWSERLYSETVMSVSQISNQRSGTLALPFIVSASLDESRDFDAVGLKQDWTYVASENWLFSFGFEGKHQDATYRFSSTKRVSEPFGQILDNIPLQLRSFDLAPEGAQYSSYFEARWQFHQNLIVDAGLRWDLQSYTTADNDAQTSPRLSLLYKLGPRTELRMAWGQFSQAQEINELQVSDGVGTFFAAQRAEHIVANIKHQFANDINVDISYYRKHFRTVRPRFENAFNPLTLLPELQFDRYRIDPISAEALGAELMVSDGNAAKTLFWWVGYAWAEVRDTTQNRKVARNWDQTHTLKTGLSWRWSKWDLSVAGEVHTGWPRTQLLALKLNSSRYSVFHTLDARVSRVFAVPRGDLTVFLEVSNLYDRDNPCCTEYFVEDSPAGLQLVSKEAHWLPLVPSLGVTWRF